MSITPTAIFYALLGIAALSAMDAAVKLVALEETVLKATWLRYAFGGLLLLPLLVALRRPLPGPAGLRSHALRGLLLTFTSLTFFYGISVLPLAEAIALAFVAPLMAPPLAALLIGEPMRGRAVLAAAVGFGGVTITVQGGPAAAGAQAGGYGLAVASILASALLYTLQALILRHRAQRDDILAVAGLAMIVPLLILTPAALWFSPLPGISALGPAALSGLFGGIGVLALARAYAHAEAQVMMIFEYTGLFWAALLGWLLFAEIPRPQVFVGAFVIAVACLLVTRGRQRSPVAKQSAF